MSFLNNSGLGSRGSGGRGGGGNSHGGPRKNSGAKPGSKQASDNAAAAQRTASIIEHFNPGKAPAPATGDVDVAAPRVNPPIQPQRHAEGTAESKRGNEEGDGRRQPPSEIRQLEEAKKEVTHADDKIRRRARPKPKVGCVYAQIENQKTKRNTWRLDSATSHCACAALCHLACSSTGG